MNQRSRQFEFLHLRAQRIPVERSDWDFSFSDSNAFSTVRVDVTNGNHKGTMDLEKVSFRKHVYHPAHRPLGEQ